MLNHRYRAKLIRVIDGDTIVANLDLGFSMYYKAHIRLARVNSPELPSIEGQMAREYLEAIIEDEIIVDSVKLDKYGRILGVLYNYHPTTLGKSLNDQLTASGNAEKIALTKQDS